MILAYSYDMIRFFILLLTCSLAVGAHAQDFRQPELNVQFHRARTAWSTGNSLLEAKARIDRVLAALPEDVEALKLRSSILADLGRDDTAFLDAAEAVKLAPEDGEAHLLLCESAARLDDIPKADQALETASNLFLDGMDQYVRLSACASSIGAHTRSESLARVAVAQDGSDPRGHVQLARAFLQAGRGVDARAVLDRMVAENLLPMRAVLADSQLAQLYRDDSDQ